jgi:hypothetical protein
MMIWYWLYAANSANKIKLETIVVKCYRTFIRII